MSSAHEFHKQAEHARETGQFVEAKLLYEQAHAAALLHQEFRYASEIKAAESILWRRMATESKKTEERHRYIELARAAVVSSMLLARQAEFMGDKSGMALALLNQAKLYKFENRLSDAIQSMEWAITYAARVLPPDHNRESVRLSFQLELDMLKLQTGVDVEGSIVETIARLEALATNEDEYTIAVWVTGAYLVMAEHFIESDLEKAKLYLEIARKIIDFDDRLHLRKGDFSRIEDKILAARM